MSSAAAPTERVRRPYRGSCHCGAVKYIVHITLPPAEDLTAASQLYKCNCSICHKAGLFHLRCPAAPEDFALLAPELPAAADTPEDRIEFAAHGLTDYKCHAMRAHWLFCATCGVRCFTFQGASRVATVDVDGTPTRVWTPASIDRHGAVKAYLSVNALTLESGQEGADLRKWLDNKWVAYVDSKDNRGATTTEYPHAGGTW